MKRQFDLEEHTIEFAAMIVNLTEKMNQNYVQKHLGHQLLRSGTSPALNYGEAQAAESSKDFIHKMSLCLKELRESQINLKIIKRSKAFKELVVEPELNECSQLVAIFTKSIQTAKGKQN